MIVEEIKKSKLIRAGYQVVPVHCEDSRTIEEFVRPLRGRRYIGEAVFPRFHVKYRRNGWDIHFDRTRQHGREFRDSIITEGKIIKDELFRIAHIKHLAKIEKSKCSACKKLILNTQKI